MTEHHPGRTPRRFPGQGTARRLSRAVLRKPVRVRLAAAFTAVMALVLTVVAMATLAHMRASLDDSINESLSYRLRDLQPEAARAAPMLAGGDPDTAAQIVDADGRLLASTDRLAHRSALGPGELAAARHGLLLTDRAALGNIAGPVRLAAAPSPDGRRIIIAAQTLADRDEAVADLRRELALGFPVVLAAAAIGAYLLAGAVLRPVERMRARAATITAADSNLRLPLPDSSDELARLGATFNDLLDRLHAALARERAFVADASHDLRTPLSLLTTELELALHKPRTVAELTDALRSALEETDRLSRLAQDLLLLAHTDQPTTTGSEPPIAAIPLHPVLNAVLSRYDTQPAGRGGGEQAGQLVSQQAPGEDAAGLSVRADPDDLDRMISNLLHNAVQHGQPPITITTRFTHHRSDQPRTDEPTTDKPRPDPRAGGEPAMIAVIEVQDHGPGFDPDFLPRAFDRFSRADAARSRGGTGLGLAIVAALATRNHGEVKAVNHPDGGALLILTLPAITTAEDTANHTTPTSPSRSGSPGNPEKP